MSSKERERLLEFFSARYYDCENEQQKFIIRQQLVRALANLDSQKGQITEKLIKEVNDLLPE